MHKLTFYPLGSADSILIDLSGGQKILFDYANMRDPSDKNDLRCDLASELRENLAETNRNSFDVVAFTHLDADHYRGATEFFYFDHIKHYQEDTPDGPRIRIQTLWVPAAVITEQLPHTADTEAKAIQKEARERFKEKKGIRVFSRPDRLKQWCEGRNIDFGDVEHLVTDAGRTAPEFNLAAHGVEFFVHSPFAVRQNDNELEDRNSDAIVMHVTFEERGTTTKLFLSSDANYEVLSDIVTITKAKKRADRLWWDIFKLPHHCSHHSLTDQPRTGDKSEPLSEVKELFEEYSENHPIAISTSDPIPSKGSDKDTEIGANPPHRQAANYYKEDVITPKGGDFSVTMEHPSLRSPRPLVIEIDSHGATLKKEALTAGSAAIHVQSPRAG